MRRLLLCCFFSLPILANAKSAGVAPIPAPPDVSTPGEAPAVPESAAASKTEPPVPDGPEPPDVPMPVQSGENLEPDITIVRKGKDTIQEYRSNGQLYMVKVIPDIGPAYYLIDSNGDGTLDVQKSDLDRGLKVNMWKLFDWK